nr:reverse transcriptase domain-containing protein [Tanacetum cinerariifolium]
MLVGSWKLGLEPIVIIRFSPKGLVYLLYVINVDDLKEVVEANKKDRLRKAEEAHISISDEVSKFEALKDSLETVRTIKMLWAYGQRVRKSELEKCLATIGPEIPKKTRKAIHELCKGIVNRLFHAPMQHLRRDETEGRTVSDEDLREYCDKNHHQILPIIVEKLHQEKAQQEKLKAVKARLNFEEASQYFESETPNRRGNLKERLGPSSHGDTESCYQSSRSKETKTAFEKHHHKREYSQRTEAVSESERSAGGHWKSKPKKQKLSMEDDLSQPWVCEETNPFTPQIRYFDFLKTRMPSHIKTYDESEDLEDHLKIFQADAKTECWAMLTWCHMFNSTLTKNARLWFDDLPKESIDSYDDLRKAFLENYLQQIKCIKDPVEIHNIKQRNGESTKEFVRRKKGMPTSSVHGEVGHTTDECMHLKRKIEEMLKAGKLSHLIKELKQNHEKDQVKIAKKGETSGKDKPLAILMVQPCQRIAKQRITQTFSSKSVISFPTPGEENGMEGPMIIEAEMGGHCVYRIYVDGGSSLKILYERCFSKFCSEIKNKLIPANTPLVRFSREIIWPLGQISLLVKICDEEHSMTAWMNLMVGRSPYPYNGIIGRSGVKKIRAIPSRAHRMIKFPVTGGTVTLQSSMIILLECLRVSEPRVPRSAINQVKEEKIQVAIHPKYPEQTVAIGSTLTGEERKKLCDLLRRHLDVFAWKPTDMTGVPRHIAKHWLTFREGCLPIRQKKRGQAPERNKTISEEVKKLVEADIMKEVHYHSWLSNPVMVKKHDDSWRMCVDFKDLNKACPKDGYPLPKIDWKRESLCGYPYKSFMDVYKGYHRIKMTEEDEEKTSFITSQGIFSYSKMSFILKNARATYQRLWTPEAEGAFKEMKQSIAEISMLTTPKEKEELIMYPAAAKEAISAVLMTERDGKQVPVYFISRALQGPEINYTPMEKLILALVSASKRLKRYFHAHTILVITDQPIKQLLSNLEVTQRLLKWRFELGEHDIQYRPNTSVKGQILADFIVERPEDDALDTPMEDREELLDPWILGENKKADALSNITSTSFAHLSKQVLVEELREKAIDEKEILAVVEEEGHTWMTPVYEYLTEGILSKEKRKQGLCAARQEDMP